MTKLLALLLSACFIWTVASAQAEDPLSETATWQLPRPAFAQMRLDPSGTFPYKQAREPRDWNGPWTQTQQVKLTFGFSKGRHLTPKPEYDLVFPEVSIHAFNPNSKEAHGTTVTLFDGPSTAKDIVIRLIPIEGKPELEKVYPIAELSSPLSTMKWTISVRFTETLPAYIKKADK